jgi:hypothetical protein
MRCLLIGEQLPDRVPGLVAWMAVVIECADAVEHECLTSAKTGQMLGIFEDWWIKRLPGLPTLSHPAVMRGRHGASPIPEVRRFPQRA